MSKRASDGGKNGDKKKQEVSPAARRKQIIVGLVMGLIVGLVISYFTPSGTGCQRAWRSVSPSVRS